MIAYLLGAGASSGHSNLPKYSEKDGENHIKLSIPTVADMSISFRNLAYKFENYKCQSSDSDASKIESVLYILSRKLYVIAESSLYQTIDSFLKTKYLLGSETNELDDLKTSIMCAFIFWQFNNPIDRRYFDFLTNILSVNDKEVCLPNNVTMLTWNYDIQFETACRQYLQNGSLIFEKLQVFPSKMMKTDKQNKERFALFHLNGTCSDQAFERNDDDKIKTIEEVLLDDEYINLTRNEDELIKLIAKYYAIFLNDYSWKTSIKYAWEKTTEYHNFKEMIKDRIAFVEALVVIGYSFPFFNRQVDRELFSFMPKLKKIYLQVPESNQVEYKYRIQSLLDREINIVPITALSSFYIPYEF